MSSIADKFKKLLPVRDDDATVRVDNGASTMSFDDHAETVQPPEEKTVLLRRDPIEEPAPVAEPMVAANDAPVGIPLTPESIEPADPAVATASAAEPPRSSLMTVHATTVEAATEAKRTSAGRIHPEFCTERSADEPCRN